MQVQTTGAPARPYRDRYVGLVCFGVLEVLLGLMALLGLLFLAFAGAMSTAAQANPGLPAKTLLPSAVTYLLAAVFFLWIGIGSILARRWARALMLIVSWLWLLAGAMGLIGFIWIYPVMRAQMLKAAAGATAAPGTANPAGAPEMLAFMQGCVLVVLCVFYLVLPLAFVLFYRSPDVKATCEARDPHPRWTDRCPLPVLGLSLLEWTAAICVLGVAVAYQVVALFGFILSGLPALALGVAFALLLGVVARATYRLGPWAWWTTVALWCLGAASVVVTAFHPFDWQELYRQMGFNTQQIDQLGLVALLQKSPILWLSCIGMVPWLLYLAWMRRFFFPPAPPAPPEPASAAS